MTELIADVEIVSLADGAPDTAFGRREPIWLQVSMIPA